MLSVVGVMGCAWWGKAQPSQSFFVVHCDPGYAHLFGKLRQMVDYATDKGVPLTIELSPQWVDVILEDTRKLDAVRQWQALGHEIGAHHHGIYHCFWDSLTNYPIDTLWKVREDTSLVPVRCTRGQYRGTLDSFYARLDRVAGDSLLLTWGSSDPHPEVDLYPFVPYRTDGSRYDVKRAFSNPYVVTHGPYQAAGKTWGPYTTCQLDYYFIDDGRKVQSVIAMYENTAFSDSFEIVGVVTHVFNYARDAAFFRTWVDFISGKGCQTVRQILRKAGCSSTGTAEVLSAEFRSDASLLTDRGVRLRWSGRADVLLLDAAGRRVFARRDALSPLWIPSERLPPGVYFVVIQMGDQRVVRRLVHP